jgi:hypothetical protein
MRNKLIYLVSFILVLSVVSRVQAEPFSLGAAEDILVTMRDTGRTQAAMAQVWKHVIFLQDATL